MPFTTLQADSLYSAPYKKKTYKKEPDHFGSSLMLFGAGLLASALIGGIALIGVGALINAPTDESVYSSCKERYARFEEFYNDTYYTSPHKLAINIVKHSSYSSNHFLRYKENLDSDISQLKYDCATIKGHINSVKNTLRKNNFLDHNEYEYTKSLLYNLETLYTKQSILLDYLEELRTIVITMKKYRQEERDRKKAQERERERDRIRMQQQYQASCRPAYYVQPVYVPEPSLNVNLNF